MKRWYVIMLILCSAALAPGARRGSVVTFTKTDLERLMSEVCGQSVSPGKAISIHRNRAGDRLFLVGENQREAVVGASAESQQCLTASSEVVDVWRNDDGQVAAMLIIKDGRRVLMIGEAELRGNRFDLERTGQYLVISHGTDSTVNSVAKAYRTGLTIDLDAQRIFGRRRGLLVVGNNPRTGMLETRAVEIESNRLVQTGGNPIPNMRAGVRVLDYSEQSDDLLLCGVDAAGQSVFAAYNVGSGNSSVVEPRRPGDDLGLFVNDGQVRARLAGDGASRAKGPLLGGIMP
ncbi:MAG: hypothetical protein WCK47_11195 [bacterium]|nr:hypothetical protein [Candidatus Sumerlaeota bacterium]